MRRRVFIKTAAAASMAAALPDQGHAAELPSRSPNIIVVFIDDLAYGDLGCFGCTDIPTPHMDALAEKGARCTNAYVTNAPCSPSRCCLMTGMYTQRFGKYGMARGLPIPKDHPTLAEFMREAGYITGMIGKWDIGSEQQGPLDRGFDFVARKPPLRKGKRYQYEKQDGTTGFLTDLDGDYLAEFVKTNRDTPFFLYYSPYAIHEPNAESPEHYRSRSQATGKRRALAGNLIAVDDAVGKLLAALSDHNLEQDTLIFLTGDNGGSVRSNCRSAPYRGGKGVGTQYEGWVHPPMIVSWPGKIPRQRTYEGLMCTMDLYATAAAVAGKPLPERCEGKNLIPYLCGARTGPAHEALYWCNDDPLDAPRRHLKAMRWKQWRLVERDGDWQLFDLGVDPREEKNRAADHPDIVASMRKRYDAWRATLAPVIPWGNEKEDGGGRFPTGYGWATRADKVVP